MPSLFSWYNQYGSWNRMRRIQAPQTVARVDSRTSRVATALHGADAVPVNPAGANANAGDVVINMGDLGLNSPPTSPTGKDHKDTLFGPSIGVVSTAPEWCAVDAAIDEKLFKSEKKLELNEKLDDESSDEDELTPEVVKEWVRRSKEPSEPTTTLQALVNLKRPSIRLSPLAEPGSDSTSSPSPDEPADATRHQQQHGLEFEFDCDASQCFISLHAFGVPASMGEPDEQRQAAHLHLSGHDAGKESERLVLFETTLPGGFGRKLALSDGAVLELARLEAAAKAYRAQLAASAAAAAASASSANLSVNGGSGTSTPRGTGNGDRHESHRKRLTTFFRKRGNAHNNSHTPSQTPTPAPAPAIATGPALAVVDAEAAHLHPNSNFPGGTISAQNANTLATFFAGGDAEKARRKKESEEEGVRVAIRIAARDADGRPLKVRNEQVTYLHIVRQGPPAHSNSSSTPAGANGDAESTAEPSSSSANPEQPGNGDQERREDEEDSRPWVVRVVKREARIGAHAFQLHEIYGLTAHASASDANNTPHHVTPSSPTSSPEQQHTYPPTPGQAQATAETDDSPAECLLCLSAAREVVLLPCRHLVACRECAVNMVEFGAGGTVVQPAAAASTGNNDTETPSGGANAGPGGENAGTEGAHGQAVAGMTPTPATRRKRKAKGWFCPVCRQPYTSLLRITTAPPPVKGLGLGSGGADGASTGDAKRVSLTSSVDANEANEASSPSPTHQHTQQLSHPLATVAEGRVAAPGGPHANVSSEDITNAYNPNTHGHGGNQEGAMESRHGGLVSSLRPGFLRRISGRAAAATTGNPRERDLERGA